MTRCGHLLLHLVFIVRRWRSLRGTDKIIMARNDVNIVVKARDEASKRFNRISKSAGGMGSMFRKAAAAAAVFFGGRAIKRFASESLELFGVQETAATKLETALIATGNAAGFGADQLKDMAREMQKVTTFGDDVILTGISILATFKEIKGNEFERATMLAQDMSIALSKGLEGSQDLKTTMIQLGKALNDPVRGVAALSDVGVSFTADQKKMIANFIKLNDVASAQKVILDELSSEFGGQAAAAAGTYAGKILQMENAISDVKEEIGGALMPVFLASANRIKTWSEDNQKRIGQWAKKTVAAVSLGKDVFFSFATFLQDDWQSAVSFVFDSFLTLLEATFKSATKLAILGGKGIWEGVKSGLQESLTESELAKEIFKSAGGQLIPTSRLHPENIATGISNIRAGGFRVSAEQSQLFEESKREAERMLLDVKVEKLFPSDMLKTILEPMKAAGKKIADAMPPNFAADVDADFAKFQARIEAIMAPAARKDIAAAAKKAADDSLKVLKEIAVNTGRKLPARESRFLTFNTSRNRPEAPERSNLTATELFKWERYLDQQAEKFLTEPNRRADRQTQQIPARQNTNVINQIPARQNFQSSAATGGNAEQLFSRMIRELKALVNELVAMGRRQQIALPSRPPIIRDA